MQGALEDQFALVCPDLQQVLEAISDFLYLLIDDLNKDRAELCVLPVLTAGHDFVETVEWHRVHAHLHEVFRVLAVFMHLEQVMILVQLLDVAHGGGGHGPIEFVIRVLHHWADFFLVLGGCLCIFIPAAP